MSATFLRAAEVAAASFPGTFAARAERLDGDARLAWNDTAEFPGASVIKIAVALEVLASLDPAERLAVRDEDEVIGSGVLAGMDAGSFSVRTGATGSVKIGGSSEEFDSVILAAPLPAMLAALDASPEERNLMSRIKTYRYFATLFEDTKLPDGQSLFLHGKSHPAQLGETIIFGNFSYEPRLWTSYQLADRRAAPAVLKAQLARDSRALGGEPGAILMQKEWDYFPHVGTADLEADFYPRMEALQGKNRTYYAGGIMNFESTEFVAEYSQRLVDRFF